MINYLFYILSFAMLLSGLMVISSRNPVNSAIFLILVFFFMAGLFVLLEAFFLAAVQILVYAGAVMVLFLFVIMLLNIKAEGSHRMHWFGIAGAVIIVPILALEFLEVLKRENPQLQNSMADGTGTIQQIGKLLFSKHLIPFEIASILLLVAMIGVIILSKRESKV